MQKIFKTGAIFWERHCVSVQLSKPATNRPFSIPTQQLNETLIKVQPHYVQAQGPPLSPKASFVGIDPADWTVSGYNHPF